MLSRKGEFKPKSHTFAEGIRIQFGNGGGENWKKTLDKNPVLLACEKLQLRPRMFSCR
jgi:hypothetical protein